MSTAGIIGSGTGVGPAPDVAILDALTDLGLISETSAGSFSVSAGDDRLLVYIQYVRGLADVDRQVSYGGQNMTSQADFRSGTGGDDVRVRIWTLDDAGIAAAVDTGFDVAGAAGGVRYRAAAVSYENVDQTTPVNASGGDTGEDPSATDLTTEDGGFVVAGAAQSDDNQTVTWTGVTEKLEVQQTQMSWSAGDAATDGTSITVTADHTGTDVSDQAMAVITLNKA